MYQIFNFATVITLKKGDHGNKAHYVLNSPELSISDTLY